MTTLNDIPTGDNSEPRSLGSILLPQHLTDLRRSGLSDEQILNCGFYSLSDPAEIAKLLGWKTPAKNLGPCLCIPFFGADGKELDYARVKPDKPRKARDGGAKPIKYESRIGAANRAYFPPNTRAALADPTVPLIITEGEKKAAKADQDGFPCVGLVGVYGWQKARPRNSENKGTGPRSMIPDLAGITLAARKVFIGFDSDIVEKPQVRWAEWHQAEALRKRGAEVLVLRIPPAANGDKQGLDDFLVAVGPTGLRELLAAAQPPEQPEPETNRAAGSAPVILIGEDEHRANDEACAALGRESGVYERGGLLVHVVRQEAELGAEAVVRRPSGTVSVRSLPKPLLRERLTRCARWCKVVMKDDEESLSPAHPPHWAVDAVYTRGHWPAVPQLNALVTHPVLLADGSILHTTGYHPSSGLLVSLPPGLTVNVPDRPTRGDVKAAVAELQDVLYNFPFEAESHRAAWFASLLTPLAWFAFCGQSPLYLIDGNVRGVGKGLLGDVAAIILTGRRFPVMNYTNDKEELRKKITTLAVEGERLVLLDNLAGVVGNDVLDMALTADSWKDRILGTNLVYNGPLNLVWYATGNNVQFTADTARRVCHIRIESPDECPDMKADFRYKELRTHVAKNRGSLLAAALTILRGWVVAGRPTHGLRAWGSFEQWSGVVREAVVFAGLPDPGETRLQLQTTADRDAAAMGDIIVGFAAMDPERRGLTSAEVVQRLKDGGTSSDRLNEMRAAVEELCGKLCGKVLGYKFRHFVRRNFNGLMIDKAGSSGTGSNRWVVVPVNATRHHSKTSPVSPASPDSRCRGSGDAGHAGDVSARGNGDNLFTQSDISSLWH